MSVIYNRAKQLLLDSSIDLTGDTLRVALIATDSNGNVDYTPSIDDEHYVSHVFGSQGNGAATELDDSSGTNYERKTLSTTPITEDDSNDRAVFDGDDITWSLLDTPRDVAGVLLYKQVGSDDSTPGDDPVIAYFDGPDFPKATNGSDFTVSWDADGIIHGT